MPRPKEARVSPVFRGKLSQKYEILTTAYFSASYGFNAPTEFRANGKTVAKLFGDEHHETRFNSALLVRDDSMSDGIVEFRNSYKSQDPLYQSKVIFEDFEA